jgi:arylsulfatase A-like enzyme
MTEEAAITERAKRPNVLLILTDQLRWDHVGFGGNEVVQTPHLDALARSGTVFDRAYVANPICMPNRASIFTGRMPSLHRVRVNGVPLDPRQSTFSDALRRSGYRTGYVGKLHLQNAGNRSVDEVPEPVLDGDAWQTSDLPAGWERYEGYARHEAERVEMPNPFYGFEDTDVVIHHGDLAAGPYTHFWRERGVDVTALRGQPNMLPCEPLTQHVWRTAVPEEVYPTTYVADRAIEALGRYAAGSDPFLLVASFPDPHHPFTPPGRYWDMYRPDDMPLPATFDVEHRNPMGHHAEAWAARGTQLGMGPVMFSPDAAQFRQCVAAEYGMITMLDHAIGRMLGELDRLGIADDTVVIFTSDHGDMMGDHGLILKVANHWDGCTRVPLVVKAPGHRAGRTDAYATSTDIAPTVLSLCGVLPYAGLQGEDLVPVIDGDAAAVRSSVFIEEDQLFEMLGLPGSLMTAAGGLRNHGGIPGAALRMRTVLSDAGRLTWYAGSDQHELYDSPADPDQSVNRWGDPGAASLQRELTELLVAEMVRHVDDGPMAREFA